MGPRTQRFAAACLLLAVTGIAGAGARPSYVESMVDRFAHWVDLADGHRKDWERAASGLTVEQRSAATRLANKLFGGAFRGYWLQERGYARARGEHFLTRSRVRRAPGEIVEPARDYLLWRLATMRAENLRRRIDSAGADDPDFWEAYGRHVAHGRHFGFLSERTAYVIPRVMVEALLGDRLHEKGLISGAAAHAMVASAHESLRRALRAFADGQVDEGMFLVTDAVRSLRRARGFGIQPGYVRHALRRHFAEELASERIVTVFEGAALTFREALRDGIAFWKARSDRRIGYDLRPFADLLLASRADAPAGRPHEFTEDVVVEADAVWLNFEGYALRELEVLIDDVAGRPVLRRYAELEILGKLLFAALLHEKARDRAMAQVRSACTTRLRDGRGGDVTQHELAREIAGMGHRILALPGVADELARTVRGEKLLGQLRVLDSPGFHAHLGNLWVARALRLARDEAPRDPQQPSGRVEAWREARAAYLEAAARFPVDAVPHVLHELAEAAAEQGSLELARATGDR